MANRESDKAGNETDAPQTKAGRTSRDQDRDMVYRPDENIDNQKSPEGQIDPGHNSSIEQTPVKGWQSKEKSSQKANINDKADEAKSSRRNG